ncbi:MAG TPA: DMT family transporter [Geminicoccus sp.]|jgi:drug/metabolite transporter (DMT)-like permease|uniref:DMT family transporter n=1 Tax=Geminicoccus sp. TaxID=2024832 RepID=UPI002E3216D6|nr:DMT family transporter [Geminicoccus sp.]HEX2528673.1 DMT family transporter [Geminicoccus sp.]
MSAASLAAPFRAVELALGRRSAAVQAAFWMVLAAFLFSWMGALVRVASVELHPFELAFFRMALVLPIMLPLICRRGVVGLRLAQWRGYLMRASFSIIGLIGGFYALVNMRYADSIALSFTLPIFATIGAAWFLKEDVRLRRWMAVLIGFLGMLVIIRPGSEALNLFSLIAIGAAAAAAGATLTVKRLSRTEPAGAIVANLALYLTPMTLAFALPVWVWPSLATWGLLLIIGALGTVGQIALTRAYAAADASVVMPFDYLRLPFGAFLGFVMFAERPDLWTFVGAGIIAGSSIYIAYREATQERVNRKRPQPVEPDPHEATGHAP